MLENQLITLIVSILRAGLTAAGGVYATCVVSQAEQPTQQGVPSAPGVFLTKLPLKRYGFLGRNDQWDEDEEVMVHTETQIMESTFQISALAIQNPADINAITPSDIVNRAASIMQSDNTRATLNAAGVGILRIQQIAQPFFIDDKGRNEASPSFDFTLTHKQVIITETPVVVTEEFNVNRV